MQDEPNSVDLQQEAKELILKELEEKGVINYMRAKIKKSIIDIISSQSEAVQQKFDFDYMTPLHRLNKPKEIVLVCQLIKEFLKFYELEYTLPIFENESNIKENIKRETLLKEVKLENQKDNSKPVLLLLLLDKLNRKEELFNNQNKKNIDMNSKSERDSVNSENKKIELNPTTFGSTNKSLEMAEPMTVDKFNNFNINEDNKNENEIKNEENNLNENKGQNDDKLNEIKDIKFEEIKNNEIKNIENLNDKNGAKNNNENLQEGIKEDIEGKEIKEKDENKISENLDSQSGQAFESTASNK